MVCAMGLVSVRRHLRGHIRFYKLAYLYVLLYCSTSSNLAQGLPLNLKMRSSSKNRGTYHTYNQTLDDPLQFLSAEHAHLDRKPRGINAVLDQPTTFINGRLQSRSGYHFLEIVGTRQIAGTVNACSEYALIQLQSYNRTLKKIKGKKSGLYLAINRRGRLYATLDQSNLDTLFVEIHEENNFLTYSSSQYPRGGNGTWFLSIKRNGLVKRPSRTKVGMESTQFNFLKNNQVDCKKS